MRTREADVQLTTIELPAEQRARAVRAIAAAASDARECGTFLDMLGLSAEEGFPALPEPRR